jgi:hypothetical protein
VGDQSRIGFENTYFMGPALFASDTYALAGQNKTYLEVTGPSLVGATIRPTTFLRTIARIYTGRRR